MNSFNVTSMQDIVDVLKQICGTLHVFTAAEELYLYGKDETLNLHFPFEILVKPGSAQQIAAVVKVCNRYNIPITPRGGGSGVTGGALPVKGGIVLSTERLNKIISINTTDHYVVAECGVLTADLLNAVQQQGLCLPVAPTSSYASFIGGNVAENAGSMASCKYGVTGNYVLNLEVVLPNGEITWTGANVAKNVTGLNLTQLFVGSEGTLGIITKVVYRLLPAPPQEVLLLAAFERLEDACNAVSAIRNAGILPSAAELICNSAIRLTAAFLNEPLPLVKENIEAHLLIGLEPQSENEMIAAAAFLQQHASEDVLLAQSQTEKHLLQKLRFGIGKALTGYNMKYRDIDACVPLSALYDYIRQAEEICRQHDVPMVCFGHALDGNMHTMLLMNEAVHVADEKNIRKAVAAIYACAIGLGGVISGEHGIGLLQKEYMPLQLPAAHISLLQSIKNVFDPNGILNPGKII